MREEVFRDRLQRQPSGIEHFPLLDLADGSRKYARSVGDRLANSVTACREAFYDHFKEIRTDGFHRRRQYEPKTAQCAGI